MSLYRFAVELDAVSVKFNRFNVPSTLSTILFNIPSKKHLSVVGESIKKLHGNVIKIFFIPVLY